MICFCVSSLPLKRKTTVFSGNGVKLFGGKGTQKLFVRSVGAVQTFNPHAAAAFCAEDDGKDGRSGKQGKVFQSQENKVEQITCGKMPMDHKKIIFF